MHNAVFDCMITEAYFKISLIRHLHTDTMILAHFLNENRKVGLKDLAYALFGESATSEQQAMKASVIANGGIWEEARGGAKEMYKATPELLGEYGAKDTILTFKLFTHLLPELDGELFDYFYKDETMPLLKGPTYQLNTVGLQIDTNKLLELKKTLEAECLAAKDFVYQEIQPRIKDKYPGTKKSNTFNIGSSQQLAWLLFGVYGLEFGTLTKGGRTVCKSLLGKLPYHGAAKRAFINTCLQNIGQVYAPEGFINGKKVKAKLLKAPWAYIACDKITLVKLSHRYEWIKRLLEYKKKQKLLNTYVDGLQERLQYGIIYSSFLQHGTKTGRYSSRNPNFQNLPRDDKRIKACITARPGKVFVGADYSQLEPRIFAYYSRDPRLLASFDGSSDFYSVIGIETFDISDATPQKEGSADAFGTKYKTLRDISKVVALSATYGTQASKLSTTIGKSMDETQEVINSYFEKFPGVRQYQLEQHALVKKQGYVTNIFGRPRRLPEAKRLDKIYGPKAHSDLPYEARNILNQAVNYPIQSTGGALINRAAIKFYNDCTELGINAPLVSQVHDFLAAECDKKDAEIVSLLLQNALETTTILEGVALEAVPKIGSNLAEV